MSSTPIKSGLKYIVLCEADTGYVLYGILHDKDMANLEEAGNYKVIAWLYDLLTSKALDEGLSFLGQNYEVIHFVRCFLSTA